MINRKCRGLAALVFALMWSSSVLAGPQRNQGGQGQAQAPVIAPMAESEQEVTAFNAVRTEANPATKITLADTFLTTYPNSEYAGYIHRFRMEAFRAQNKPQDTVTAAQQGLDAETKFYDSVVARAEASNSGGNNRNRNSQPAPIDKNSDAYKTFVADFQKTKLYYYQIMMTSYQQLNDAPKTIEFGEKALATDPEDLASLLTVSSVMAERVPASETEKEAHLKRAEELAKKSITRVNQLAPAMPPAQKTGLESTVHQTLGTIYLHEKKFGDAQKEFQSAIASKNDDPVAYFRLGLAYAQATPERVDEAMEALGKSVFLGGVTKAQATDILKKLYEAKKKTLDGFDEFVEASGKKIGQ